jgi:protein-disulfide isomerase
MARRLSGGATLVCVAVAALLSCHEDSRGERDTKGRANAVIAPGPTAPTPLPPLAPEAPTVLYRVPIGTSPALGSTSALVTLVEFSDFQCPFCKRAEPTVSALRAKYGDDLRVVWKNEPLANHERAKPAAELAMAARDQGGDAMFWKVHDDLYASSLDDAALSQITTSYGVKRATTHHKALDDDHALAGSLGITVIPVFFVNGRKIVGAQDLSVFTTLVDAELADARARVAKGTARDKVYDEIMATAQ